ncbi:MAG: peptidoglycan editing factor PgeF [bacterium]|nr:peptidoglycan editing factor PgeF [bacterium]
MWLKADNISCSHGFSTRHLGVSSSPFESMNLGGTADLKINIEHNREKALQQLRLSADNLCTLKQVHGTTVCQAEKGSQTGDALVTNKKNRVLAVSVADCYPILFYDKTHAVIGAAHAGWRGTCAKIVSSTISEMLKLGAHLDSIQVAIGQGISQKNFEVGNDVIKQFQDAGFPETCWHENKIDLIKCNEFVLAQNHIPTKNIWKMNRCTFEDDFFSYRRDKGLTGRMWGIISLH